MTQAGNNPYAYSGTNKRYRTYDHWCREIFGGKVAKIPLDGGFSCPNLDGKCGTGGCIYCSGRGSGDFAPPPTLPLIEQYRIGREKLSDKWPTERCIAYFQARTNTYAPVAVLQEKFEEVLAFDGVVGLSVATRADCLPPDTVDYLADLSGRTKLTVELGLQTIHDKTAAVIHRGHTFADFLDGYHRLTKAAPEAFTCIHLIFGLPGEDRDMMLDSMRRVASLRPTMVKIHLLHVLHGTKLADKYTSGAYTPMTREAYVAAVVDALELLPPETAIARLTGDGAAADLLAPAWSRAKRAVLACIDKELYRRDTFQGRLFNDLL